MDSREEINFYTSLVAGNTLKRDHMLFIYIICLSSGISNLIISYECSDYLSYYFPEQLLIATLAPIPEMKPSWKSGKSQHAPYI